MSEHHSRTEYRTEVGRVELVTIFRDRRDMAYDQAVATLANSAAVYNLFSVVAVVRDASQQGVGLKFEGQQIMSVNVLKPGERYLLKFTIPNAELDGRLSLPFLNPEGTGYHFVLVKGVCRWCKAGQSRKDTSKVGFELAENNTPEVVRFIQEFFGLISEE